ncbi:uncharacterized protein LOC112951786 [Nothoprocta perdicaria]|uniref:uncharacterized protein LOC112951786 n=1 Tax=Nothoprocta perdicaria TaxID=30464 RepID=UPI000E1C2781|nr:uncharacterized protein LOC112951786 [Nothoprocta perdicaria]
MAARRAPAAHVTPPQSRGGAVAAATAVASWPACGAYGARRAAERQHDASSAAWLSSVVKLSSICSLFQAAPSDNPGAGAQEPGTAPAAAPSGELAPIVEQPASLGDVSVGETLSSADRSPVVEVPESVEETGVEKQPAPEDPSPVVEFPLSAENSYEGDSSAFREHVPVVELPPPEDELAKTGSRSCLAESITCEDRPPEAEASSNGTKCSVLESATRQSRPSVGDSPDCKVNIRTSGSAGATAEGPEARSSASVLMPTDNASDTMEQPTVYEDPLEVSLRRSQKNWCMRSPMTPCSSCCCRYGVLLGLHRDCVLGPPQKATLAERAGNLVQSMINARQAEMEGTLEEDEDVELFF